MKVTLSTSGGTLNLGGAVTVTAAISSSSAQITRVEFFVDSVLDNTVTSAPYSYSWDTTASLDGSHQLKARAFYPRNQVAEIKLDVTVLNTVTSPPDPPVEDPPVLMEIEE